MIRKKDLDKKTAARSKKIHRRSKKKLNTSKLSIKKAKPKSNKKTDVHPDGSGYDDIVLARRRGVFGMALIVLAIGLLVIIL